VPQGFPESTGPPDCRCSKLIDFFHHCESAVRAGSDHEALAFPRYLFLDGQRRVAELLAEFLGGLLLALADFAAIDHDIVLVGAAVDLDGAESEFVEMHTRTPWRWPHALLLDVRA
jgi:hypothetical protein